MPRKPKTEALVPTVETSPLADGLTRVQQSILSALLDPRNKHMVDVARAAGVSKQSLYEALKSEKFLAIYNRRKATVTRIGDYATETIKKTLGSIRSRIELLESQDVVGRADLEEILASHKILLDTLKYSKEYGLDEEAHEGVSEDDFSQAISDLILLGVKTEDAEYYVREGHVPEHLLTEADSPIG